MWRELWQLIKRIFGLHDFASIRPHPPMTSDQGERDQIERKMEKDSMHAGSHR